MIKSIIKAFLLLILCISIALPIQAFNLNFGSILGAIKTELYNNKYGLALAGVIGIVAYIAYKKQVQKHRKEKRTLSRQVQALLAEREAVSEEAGRVCDRLDSLLNQNPSDS